jgi:hypothetical protein
MLTAKEAKEATEKNHQQWKDSSWKRLKDAINDKILGGHYTLQAMLTNEERDQFIKLGYTVKKIGSCTYNIYW